MIKYFEELDKNNSFVLPLVRESYHVGRLSSSSFRGIEYDFIKNFDQVFNIVNILMNFIENYDNNYIQTKLDKMSHSEAYGYYIGLGKLEEFQSNIAYFKKKQVITEYYDISVELDETIEKIKFIASFDKQVANKFKYETMYLADAKNYIDRTFVYNKLKKEINPINFPYVWYITKYGHLYHPGFNNPHKETNLIYPQKKLEDSIATNKRINSSESYFLGLFENINKQGYITYDDFDHYLHFTCSPEKTSDNKIYEPNSVTLIKGIISANAAMSKFYSDLSTYSKNPIKELERLKHYTSNDRGDLFVMALGIHKVERVLDKTITTNSLTPYSTFKEYIKRGWNINVIDSIVVDKYKQRLEYLDISKSIIAQRLLEKELNEYEKVKTKTYGRIY